MPETIYMLECFFFPKRNPIWVGWNSLQTPDKHDAQESMYYLLQINYFPTSTAMVTESLKRAQ